MTIPSASQTPDSLDRRGQDYSDEETQRALAHRADQIKLSKNKHRVILGLKGNRNAYIGVVRRWRALAKSSPNYEEFD